MGAWVPVRSVPWCLGRLPWAPGAPPGGSLGGGPGPKSAAQNLVSLHRFRIIAHQRFVAALDGTARFGSAFSTPKGDQFSVTNRSVPSVFAVFVCSFSMTSMLDLFFDFSPLSTAQTVLGVLSRPPRVTNFEFQIALCRLSFFHDFDT